MTPDPQKVQETWANALLLDIARILELNPDYTLKNLPDRALSVMTELKKLRHLVEELQAGRNPVMVINPLPHSGPTFLLARNQLVTLAAEFTTLLKKDIPVKLPTWLSSDKGVLALTVSNDGMTTEAVATGAGEVRVMVTAEADLSPTIRFITGALNIVVIEPTESGVAVNIIPGIPIDKPTV